MISRRNLAAVILPVLVHVLDVAQCTYILVVYRLFSAMRSWIRSRIKLLPVIIVIIRLVAIYRHISWIINGVTRASILPLFSEFRLGNGF